MRKVWIEAALNGPLEPRTATRHSHWRFTAVAAMSQQHAKLGNLEAKQNLREMRRIR
jgi:hypothetical protein